MPEPKNIQIPYSTFKTLLDVLEYIDIQKYDEAIQNEFESVLEVLRAKQYSIEKREAYSRLIQANKQGNENQQLDARIDYLQKKTISLDHKRHWY